MRDKEKITDGLNDRPLNDTIAQSGAGLPDDSSAPVEVDRAEQQRVRGKLGAKPEDRMRREVAEQTGLPQRGSA